MPESLLGARLVEPEIHQVQSADDEDALQALGLLTATSAQAAGAGQADQGVLAGEEQLQLGVAVEDALDGALVVPATHAQVHLAVGVALDDGCHSVRGHLGDHRGTGHQIDQRVGDAEHQQKEVIERRVVKGRYRDGQHAAEDVADGRLPGKAPVHVVREEIEAVDQVEHTKDRYGVVRHTEAKGLLQYEHAHDDFQQQYGNARVHERVTDAFDADMLPPVGQGAALGATGGHDHLDHVAHTG